jgi:hypothetical protein
MALNPSRGVGQRSKNLQLLLRGSYVWRRQGLLILCSWSFKILLVFLQNASSSFRWSCSTI